MKKIYLTILSISFLLNQENANAQAGTKDITFGNQGQLSNENYPASTYAIAVMADAQHIYAASNATNVQDIALADSHIKCFSLDGSVNTAFGESGVVLLDSLGITDAELSSDGQRILFLANPSIAPSTPTVGYVDLNTQDVFRFALPINVSNSYSASFMEVDDNGKIILCGILFHPSDNSFAAFLVRLNEDFSMDNTFSDDGYLEFESYFPAGSQGMISMHVDHSANVFVNYAVDYVTHVRKVLSNGSEDTSFTLAPEATATGAAGLNSDMQIAADNSIYFLNSGWYDQHIINVNNDGSLNTSFAQNGVLALTQPSTEFAVFLQRLLLQPNGDLVLSGNCISNSIGHAVGKYLLKATSVGIVVSDFGQTLQPFAYNGANNYDYAGASMTTQSDGKVLCYDFIVNWVDGNVFYDVMLTRFLNSGVVSISENLSQEDIFLYPNPAQSFINFKRSGENIANTQVKIFDSMGKFVLSKKLQGQSLNIEDLSSGFYSIELIEGTERNIVRLVKE